MERFLKIKSKEKTSAIPSSASNAELDLAAPVLPELESSTSSIDSPSDETIEKRCLGKKSKTAMKAVVPTKKRIVEAKKPNIVPMETFDVPESSSEAMDNEATSKKLSTSDNHKSVTKHSQRHESVVNNADSTNEKKKYKQKFKESWTSKFPWLEMKSNQPFCKACLKVISGGKSHLERHETTSGHQMRVKSSENTVEIQNLLENDQQQERNKQVRSAELKMTMFLHEHNLPFHLMDHFPKFISSICPDSKVAKAVKCARTKATSLTKDCIAAQQVEEISNKLRNSVFSIIIDETTDISSEKSLAIVARFYDDRDEQSKDRFLGLLKVTSCTAEDLFNAICKFLQDLKIPLSNMIGFAADNASVMMGNLSGVQARFKQVIPNLFVLGCVCHSFHLCASAAAHQLPRSLEDLVRGIYNYFSHSSNRLARLQEFQVFVDLKPHKMLHPSQTRWLSLQAAVDRVLENWDALILFFTNECFEDNLSSTQTILAQLKSPIFKVYFTFLSYVLDLVNKLNVEFQSEKPKIYLLLSRVRGIYRTILRNYIAISHLDSVRLQKIEPSNPRNFVKLENIYFGANTDLLLSNENIDPQEVHNFRTKALAFYVTLVEQIKKRFNFDDPTLLFVSQFNPVVALSGDIRNIASEASKLFPQLVDNIESLNSEWRLLADLEELKSYKDDSIEQFWTRVFKMKNQMKDLMFPNLTKLIKGILCLPHSSAAAERVFSQLTLLKNKTRNRLLVNTVQNVLHAKELLGNNTCYSWQPSSELLKRKPKYATSINGKE